jgi:hypothetical protein
MTLKRKTIVPLTLLVISGAAFAADPPKQPAGNTPTKSAPAPADTGRDWTRIDTNKDGSISPEEMEKFLAENPGPLKQ